MQPSRELDALVAERVMGLKVKPEGSYEVGPVYVTPANSNGFTGEDAVPDYSTGIAAAWTVVEKMNAYNPFWEEADTLYFEISPTKPPGWMVNFGDDTTREFAATAPHAICLAALKAIGAL